MFSDKCHRVPTHKQFKTDEDVNRTSVLKVLKKKRRVFRERERVREKGGRNNKGIRGFCLSDDDGAARGYG